MSHVVYCVQPENLDSATNLWSNALEVEFDRLDLHDGALRISFSLAHGVEIVAPAPNGPAKFHQFLEEHGEGVYTVVYVVADIEPDGIPTVGTGGRCSLTVWCTRAAFRGPPSGRRSKSVFCPRCTA